MNKHCISQYLQIVRRKMNMIPVLLTIAVAILIIPNTALALTFNFTFGDGFSPERKNEMIEAGNQWASILQDNVTVNVKVVWGDPEKMGYADDLSDTGNKKVSSFNYEPRAMKYSFMRDRMV